MVIEKKIAKKKKKNPNKKSDELHIKKYSIYNIYTFSIHAY